eukprot:1061862-Prorocentrum_minimum.AAC.1
MVAKDLVVAKDLTEVALTPRVSRRSATIYRGEMVFPGLQRVKANLSAISHHYRLPEHCAGPIMMFKEP